MGTALPGRDRPEDKGVVGNFVSTVALGTEIEESLTFDELLSRVEETVDSARAHADLPFEHVVELLKPPRDLSFNIMGKPIVESPYDAIRCLISTGIDFLVLGNYVIAK